MIINSAYRQTQSGSAFVYILIAIALLAALTASFMRPASQQSTAQNTYQAITALKSQVDFIQSSIQECVLTYQEGDKSGGASADPPGYPVDRTDPYPINPMDSYLDSPAINNNVEHIRCPGNPGNSNDHADIFGGASGKFLPPPPDLFTDWEYYNGADGIFFFTSTNKTDPFINSALLKLDEQFSECQADVISANGGDADLTSTSNERVCEDGSTCFRVWMIIKSTAVYNGDDDGEENALDAGGNPVCP
jgi:hypothetical protein